MKKMKVRGYYITILDNHAVRIHLPPGELMEETKLDLLGCKIWEYLEKEGFVTEGKTNIN